MALQGAVTAPPADAAVGEAGGVGLHVGASSGGSGAPSRSTQTPTAPSAVVSTERPVSGRSRNLMVLAGATALLVAFALGLLAANVLRGLDSASIASPSSGLPTGLAVSVTDATTVHSLASFGGFTFDDEPLTDGRPRQVGHSADGRGRIELVGPPDDLTELSLRVPTPMAATELPRFAALWYPAAQEFVIAQTAKPTGETVRQTFGGVEVSVRVREGGDSTVTIAGRP